MTCTREPVLKFYQDNYVPDPVTLLYGEDPTDTNGTGVSGSLILTDCAITQRQFDNIPLSIELGGAIVGVLNLVSTGGGPVGNRAVDGTFNVQVGVSSFDQAVIDALENNCTGGIPTQ